MARGRMISTEIWKSEKVASFSFQNRLLWIGLITTADDQGRGRSHPGIVRSAVFPIEDIPLVEISDGLQLFVDNGLITIYEADNKQLPQRQCRYQRELG